jgi:predicted metal-binding membrane protein
VSSDRAFWGGAALVFLASVAVTIAWCGSMSAMPGMEMPGGWIMTMAWMRMPGQTWPGAAAAFVGMWTMMMIAMMMPAFAPMLARYRAAARSTGAPLARVTVAMAAGYFTVWLIVGAVVFPFGVLLAQLAMREPRVSESVPMITGALIVLAGVMQLSPWKRRLLACCRRGGDVAPHSASVADAWRQGLAAGRLCNYCCASLTAVLLMIGVMDLWAMALVMMAIGAERLMPAGQRVARATGNLLLVAGIFFFLTGLAGVTDP